MQNSTRSNADHLVSRLLNVPREERARVLVQEGPPAWDSVLFFAVRDGLRGARFGGRLSAADYLDTLQEVERRFEQTSENSMPRGQPANDDSDDLDYSEDSDENTADLIPETANEAAAGGSALKSEPARELRRPEQSLDAHRADAAARERITTPRAAPGTTSASRPPGTSASEIPREPVIITKATLEATGVGRGPGAAPASEIPREPVVALRTTPETASASAPAASPHTRVEFVPGARIRDRYVLERQIGKGGTAIVFRARDLRREAIVALKVLREELREVPDKIERLKREFRQAQALSHPNIIRVFDIDCEGGAWFLTMEALEGESLRSYLAARQPRRLPEREAIPIILACADALACAHERHQIHGDFKPENVFVTRDRHVRLLDFGVTPGVPSGGGPFVPAATPAYASPEVLSGQVPEPRDDVYSLACVAYEVLTGRHPYDRHPVTTARQQRRRVRRLPGLSRRQFAALRCGLSWSRDRRPASVRALVAELRSPERDKASGFWFSVMAIAVGALVTIAFLLNRQPEVSVGEGPSAVRSPTPPVSGAVSAGETGTREVSPAPAATSSASSKPRAAQIAAAPTPQPAPHAGEVAPGATSQASAAVPRRPAVPSSADAAATDAVIQSQLSPGSTSVVSAVAAPSPPVRSAADAAATTAVIQSQLSSFAGGVTFGQASIVVSERATQAVVRIARHGSLQRGVRVSWRTIPGTAQPGLDYSEIDSGTVSIPEDQDVRVLYIPIVDDAVKEPNKSFDVELFALDGPGRRLGPITRTRITILDDD